MHTQYNNVLCAAASAKCTDGLQASGDTGTVEPEAPTIMGTVESGAPTIMGTVEPEAPILMGTVEPEAPTRVGTVEPEAPTLIMGTMWAQARSGCSSQRCREQMEAYERWLEANGLGKSDIRW